MARTEPFSQPGSDPSSASTKDIQEPPRQTRFKHRSLMRELFAIEYIKDCNATQAAIRAGYSVKTAASQGSRLLNSASVRKAIADANTELQKKPRCRKNASKKSSRPLLSPTYVNSLTK